MTRISAYLILMLLLLLQCDVKQVKQENAMPYLTIAKQEMQSLVGDMTLEEKLGQLLVLESTLSPTCNEDSIYTYVKENLISGLLLSDTDVIQYMRIVDNCNAFSKKKFLHGTRENVSVCNQFGQTPTFPSLSSMNVCSNDSLLARTNNIFEQQLQAFNFDFAIGPNISEYKTEKDFDADNFAKQPDKIQEQARAQFSRLNNNDIFGIANSLNHYIDVDVDSLASDPELGRLRSLSKFGLSGLMLGSGFFLDRQCTDQPFAFLKEHLHQKYGYKGLIVARINNSSVSKLLHVGVDLIFVDDVRKQSDKLKELYAEGILTDAILDEKVARILKTKKWIKKKKRGRKMDVEAANFLAHYEEYDFLIRSLHEQSIVLTNNNASLIPFRNINAKTFTVHNLGRFDARIFNATFKKFANISYYPRYDYVNEVLDLATLSEDLGNTNVFLYDGAGLTAAARTEFVDKVNAIKGSQSVIVNFGNPNYLAPFASHISSIQVFDNTQYAQSAAAQLLFGAYQSVAQLNDNVNEFITAQSGLSIPKIRLKYADPREVGIDPTDLVGIDAIVNAGLGKKAMPGCQVLVAKEGKIIYSKGFGYQTYNEKSEITTEQIYDLASISKVAGTTLGTMKLLEQGQFGLKDRLKDVLEVSTKSRLKNIYIRDLLLHRSNLQPNMPIADFVEVEDSTLYACNEKYCQTKSAEHSKAVAKDFYISQKQIDTLWQKVYALKPYKKKKYRYSDVNFNILQQVVEQNANQKLDAYLDKEFYGKLGLRNLQYKPLERHAINKLVPTEFDKNWRKQIVHGYVHDEAAALQGGVAGSAGLFSNAEDLAYLFQMILNGGTYGGNTFLKDKTITDFVTPPYYSRRGYGFDKPRGKYTESCSAKASKATYGHSGFTGTCVWVDPETELIYIFLSNRIYPEINNRKLFKDKYRGRIHSVIYDALNSYKWQDPNPYKIESETKPIQS